MEVNQERIELDGMVLDGRVFYRGDSAVLITNRQAEVLSWFMRHPNRVWNSQIVSDILFGDDYAQPNLAVHLYQLRQRFGAAGIPWVIHRLGYSVSTCYVFPTSDAPEWLKNLLSHESTKGEDCET